MLLDATKTCSSQNGELGITPRLVNGYKLAILPVGYEVFASRQY
jgi:hypothetical protein